MKDDAAQASMHSGHWGYPKPHLNSEKLAAFALDVHIYFETFIATSARKGQLISLNYSYHLLFLFNHKVTRVWPDVLFSRLAKPQWKRIKTLFKVLIQIEKELTSIAKIQSNCNCVG